LKFIEKRKSFMDRISDIKSYFSKKSGELTDLRHTIHENAEVSGKEEHTAKIIQDYLKELKPDKIHTGIGGNGVAAEFNGQSEGPTVMIRCELDALPIVEANDDLPYKSKNEGSSHKCGHDGHMAILCGLGHLLNKFKPDKGRAILLFQPAEETGEGAQWVLDDSKFQDIEPDYIFALHNVPGYPKGMILHRPGIFSSASRGLIVKYKGATTHASHPENGKNPALAMAHLIEELLALPQLKTPFSQAALITIIHAKLGEIAFGTSPGYAEIMATVRTHKDDMMEVLVDKSEDISKKNGSIHDLDTTINWTQVFHATFNEENSHKLVNKIADDLSYDTKLLPEPFSWSEDFGRFTVDHKGAMFGLGSGEKQPQLHNETYDFPDEIIENGSLMFYGIVNEILNRNYFEK